MEHDTKILKLTNGDEIITTMTFENKTEGLITLQHPLKINTFPKMAKGGIEESMALSRWVSYGENDSCDVTANNFVAITDASVGIAKFYEYCVLKMKNGKMFKPLSLHEPTDEQLNQLEKELIDDIGDDMDKKTIH